MNKIIERILVVLTVTFCTPVMADLVVGTPAPVIEECTLALPCHEPNSETCRFKRAVGGAGPISPAEQARLAALLPINQHNIFYGRIRANIGSVGLSQIKNVSTLFPLSISGVTTRSVHSNQIGVEFALGYMWSPDFRADLEYLLVKNINFNLNPAFGTFPGSLSGTIKINPLLLNFYYDYVCFPRFYPYLTAGVGATFLNVTSTVVFPPSPVFPFGVANTRSVKSGHFSAQGGVGLRVGFLHNWYVDMSYRYILLASKYRIDPVVNTGVQTTLSMSIFSLGVIYLFGGGACLSGSCQ